MIQLWSSFIFGGGMLIAVIIGFWRTRLLGFFVLAVAIALQFVGLAVEYYTRFLSYDFRSVPDALATVLLLVDSFLLMLGAILLAITAPPHTDIARLRTRNNDER
jgi:hypothetical protein